MAGRRAVTRGQAVKYAAGSRAGKGLILDAVCAVTGFNHDCARRALKVALGTQVVWTENRTVRNKAQVHVFAALTGVVGHLPFPTRGRTALKGKAPADREPNLADQYC